MRTFIELEIPDEAREYIRRRQDDVCRALAENGSDVCFRWTQIASVHLTLRFLGETTESQRQLLEAGLEDAVRGWTPLLLSAGPMGGFPSVQKPRVLWLGIGGDVEGLRQLQAAVEEIVQSCGFEAETRPYSPHLTIARTKTDCSRGALQQAGEQLHRLAAGDAQNTAAGRFSAGRLVHMRSDLQGTGAVYTPLSAHHLAG